MGSGTESCSPSSTQTSAQGTSIGQSDMQKTGLRKVAASTEKDRQHPEVGGLATSVGLPLGKRIPWGAHHRTGVNVHDAMKRSTALGVRKVDFCREVCVSIRSRRSQTKTSKHARREPTAAWCCRVCRTVNSGAAWSVRWGGSHEEGFVHFSKSLMMDVPGKDSG